MVILIAHPTLIESFTMIQRSMRSFPACECEYAAYECHVYEAFVWMY